MVLTDKYKILIGKKGERRSRTNRNRKKRREKNRDRKIVKNRKMGEKS